MVGLIGKKLGHTRVYDSEGAIVPVTVVLAGPNYVLQCKSVETDGYSAVQLGFDPQKESRLNKPLLGHIKKFNGVPVKKIKEFRNFTKEVKPGDVLTPGMLFAPGDFVDCTGITKGRGFEGVVKRHGFRGGDMSHGAKGWHRRPGAIGQRSFPGTVRKGLKMPGHMGQVQRTVQNLEVVKVIEDQNILLIKGSIPGSEGDYVIIRESKKRPKGFVKRKQVEQPKAAKAKTAQAKTAAKK